MTKEHTYKIYSSRYRFFPGWLSAFPENKRVASKTRAVVVGEPKLELPEGVYCLEYIEGNHLLDWAPWADSSPVKELDLEYQSRKRPTAGERRKVLEHWQETREAIAQAELALSKAHMAHERASRKVVRSFGNNVVVIGEDSYMPTSRGEDVLLVRR